MQLQLVGELIGMFVDRILGKVFPNETGAARLQQVGLFTLIFSLEQKGQRVTTGLLAELTGQSPSAVYKQLEKLERVNVISRKKTTTETGRGFVYLLSIKHNKKTKELIEAISRPLSARAASARNQRAPSH
jgi:predicted transcriptional regulator